MNFGVRIKYGVFTLITLLALNSCNSENLFSNQIGETIRQNTSTNQFSSNLEPTNNETYQVTNDCIGLFSTFSYNVPEWDRSDNLGKILPGSSWQIESPIPVQPSENFWENLSVTVITSRNFDNTEEIWLQGNAWIDDTSYRNEFLIYTPETQEWKIVTGVLGNTGINVGWLFVSSDNTIWGLNFYDTDRAPILSRFDEESESFEFIMDLPSLRFNVNELVFDNVDNAFWFFVSGDAIYSLELSTLEIQRHTEIPNAISSIALDPDGSIYFKVNSMEGVLHEEEIFQYFPQVEEIVPLSIPEESWPSGGNLLVDGSGNLWIGMVGWRDNFGNWTLLHPNPDNYIEHILTNPYMVVPELVFQSTNGYLWLKRGQGIGIDGMAWYDPNTGFGCWFTTEYAINFVEDTKQRIWLAIDGNLFKYIPSP
jgi:hypothetical protein